MVLRLPAALALGTLLIVPPAFCQTQVKRPMTFGDLQALRRVSDPQISHSGKWVLFSVTTVSLEKNAKVNHLWAVPIDASNRPHPVTDGNTSESGARFSPDGMSVMYTSTADASSQIWVAHWKEDDGTFGESHPVTALRTEADGAIWSPDSHHFLFASSVYPDCQSKSFMGPARNEQEMRCNTQRDIDEEKNPVKAQIFDHLLYRHWNAYVGPKHSHIFLADTQTPKVPPTDLTPASVIGDHEAPTFSLGGPAGYAFSPDGKEVAYAVNLDKVPAESTNNDIYLLQLGAEPYTARKVSTSPGSDDGPLYSPDGKWLAWRSQARNGYESDKFRLMVMDRTTGNITDATQNFDGWVDEFTWKPDSSGFYLASSFEGGAPIFKVDVTGANLGYHIGGEFSDLRAVPSRAGAAGLIAMMMSVSQPPVITSVIKDSQFVAFPEKCTKNCTVEVTGYTDMNEALLGILDLPSMEEFRFDGAGGAQVEGFLLRPPGFNASQKYPVKFLMHGGPQGAWGDAWSYRWNPELLAANGYVVVMINPRGSTGYGQKFLEQVSGDWGGRAFEDLMKGLNFVEQNYPFVDKNRECALGASYGGYMANWVLTHTNRFKCIVTHDGMYNPQSAFGSTEELWFNEWEFRQMAGNGADAVVDSTKPSHPWDFYDKPADQDPYRKWSPMLNIKNAKTPTLVIHGQRDYRLDVSEGFQLFTALQLLNVPSRMLYFPDEGHWVLKPKNSELWYATVNDWCDRWLGVNKYASIGPERNPALTQVVPVAPTTETAPSKPSSKPGQRTRRSRH